MSTEGFRRPVTISIACAASLTLALLLYRNYKAAPSHPPSAGLHRSNAVRRAHRRPALREPEVSPIEHALQGILDSQLNRRVFGHYVPKDGEDTLPSSVSLDFTPSNFRPLHRARTALHPEWTDADDVEQYKSLHFGFVYGVVVTYWPPGSKVSDEDKEALIKAFRDVGIDTTVVELYIDTHNSGEGPTHDAIALGEEQVADTEDDDIDETLSAGDLSNAGGSQNVLNLLYQIAGEQAKREGYIHRGIECNGCGACPIQGIRYHCANCFDYDLCETCESHQVHIKTHVFYKVRIPAPSRGQIKQVVSKWYPGNPNVFPHSSSRAVLDRLVTETGMDRGEIGALFEQFKCLAGHEYASDPCHLGTAIDRKGFDMYFIPGKSARSTPANLIYDRIFGFYDTNDDGLIGFDEFIRGLARLQDKSRMARLLRVFEGYDLDGDGYVCRRDFLRMFRAYYDLSRQLNREMIHAQEDFGYLDEEIREVVQGSQPISAAFGGNTLMGHESRGGDDKRQGANGDLQITNGPNGVLQNDLDLRGDRYRAIGNAAIGNRPRSHPFRTFRTEPPQDEQLMQLPLHNNFELIGIQHADDAPEDEINGPDPPIHTYGWPPLLSPDSDDVIAALGADIPIEDITDPVDRTRVIFAQSQRLDADSDRYQDWQREKAVYERWKRRQFYLDQEEGFTKPQGYSEPDSSDEESEGPKPGTSASSRRQSLRSRSSSKVRFDDSAIDTDYETRSNASSRSMPQNERWGGYELSQPEFDVGRDVLYEAVQQGFNELLDPLFKSKEDEAADAMTSSRERAKWKDVLDKHAEDIAKAAEEKEEALKKADALRTEEIFANAPDAPDPPEAGEVEAQEVEDIAEAQDNEGSAEEPEVEHPADENQRRDPEASGAPSNEPSVAEQYSNQIKMAIAAAVADVQEAAKHHSAAGTPQAVEEASELAAPPELPRDPTLPQFRPDYADDKPKLPRPKTPDPPPSKETLDKWLKHREYEQQAQDRGGAGRLNFMDFRRRMVADDENSSTLSEKEDVDENDPAYWEKSADLGRLAFVGTWLEMASF